MGILRGRIVPLIEKLITLGRRQDRECAHGLRRSCLQSFNQRGQRSGHELTDTHWSDGGRRLCGESHILAKILHREGEGIVGPLLPAKYAHPFVGSERFFRPLTCSGTVPVVEHRRKQRGRRRDGTASLCEGKRCVLMMHQLGQQGMRLTHAGLYSLFSGVDAYRKSVDEEPHHPV